MSEESREFVAALEGVMERFHKGQKGLLRDRGISLGQYIVLRSLSRADDTNMSDLADLLGVRPQTVTALVDTLEEGGWAQRARSATDRRESLIELTPKGRRLLETVRATFQERVGRALEAVPPSVLRSATEALRVASDELGPRESPATRRSVAPTVGRER